MIHQGAPGGLYALRCIRCGSNLELPQDPRLFHIDCRYCGTDNVLPPNLIEARQQHHALELEHQNKARLHAERAAATKRSSRVVLVIFAVLGFLGLSLLGTCVAIGVAASREEAEAKQRATDPKLNGNEAMLAHMAKMRAESGCDRILVQPRQHRNEDASLSLDMVANNHCVHIMGATGTAAPITIRYNGSIALTKPMPAPAAFVDYRLCASETAPHAFTLRTPEEPFTVAALECPRTPAEGGARSKAGDPLTTGKTRVSKALGELGFQGCKKVVAEPAVSQGPQTFTVTSPKNGACYNMLIASHFRDVSFKVSLTDPKGKALSVPSPAQDMRVSYCPATPGEYSLSITPSSLDHFAHASIDCPRNLKAPRLSKR